VSEVSSYRPPARSFVLRTELHVVSELMGNENLDPLSLESTVELLNEDLIGSPGYISSTPMSSLDRSKKGNGKNNRFNSSPLADTEY
jgi:hypothetical protein